MIRALKMTIKIKNQIWFPLAGETDWTKPYIICQLLQCLTLPTDSHNFFLCLLVQRRHVYPYHTGMKYTNIQWLFWVESVWKIKNNNIYLVFVKNPIPYYSPWYPEGLAMMSEFGY